MRLLLAGLFFLTGMAFDLALALEGGRLPAGNYLDECSDCAITEGQLSCICPTQNGKNYIRTLDMELCEFWSVAIKKGRLFCGNEPVIASSELEDEEFGNGLPAPIQDNLDGQLPEGDYRSYCGDCKIVDGIMHCSCKIAGYLFNSWYKATLPLSSCSDLNDVSYSRGLLFCSEREMLDFLVPEGCSECRVDGDYLSCQCEKTRCGWSSKDFKLKNNIEKKSRFNNIRYCSSEIKNCNGYLRCGECELFDYWDQVQWRRPIAGEHPKHGYCYPNSPF